MAQEEQTSQKLDLKNKESLALNAAIFPFKNYKKILLTEQGVQKQQGIYSRTLLYKYVKQCKSNPMDILKLRNIYSTTCVKSRKLYSKKDPLICLYGEKI